MLKIDKNYKESRTAVIFTSPKCRLVIKQNKRALLNKDNNGRHCLLWPRDWRESRRRRLSEDRRGKRATRSFSSQQLFFVLIVITLLLLIIIIILIDIDIIIIIIIISTIINGKGQLAPSLTCRSTLATIATLSQLHQYHQHHYHHHYEYHHHPLEKEHQAQLSQVAKGSHPGGKVMFF